jgi:hypothetical protein
MHFKIYAIRNPNPLKLLSSQLSLHKPSLHASDIAILFTPQPWILKLIGVGTDANYKYQALLLDFVVSNNLALRVVDSQSHRRLIQHCNLSILTISTLTLNRDLKKTFLSA